MRTIGPVMLRSREGLVEKGARVRRCWTRRGTRGRARVGICEGGTGETSLQMLQSSLVNRRLRHRQSARAGTGRKESLLKTNRNSFPSQTDTSSFVCWSGLSFASPSSSSA